MLCDLVPSTRWVWGISKNLTSCYTILSHIFFLIHIRFMQIHVPSKSTKFGSIAVLSLWMKAWTMHARGINRIHRIWISMTQKLGSWTVDDMVASNRVDGFDNPPWLWERIDYHRNWRWVFCFTLDRFGYLISTPHKSMLSLVDVFDFRKWWWWHMLRDWNPSVKIFFNIACLPICATWCFVLLPNFFLNWVYVVDVTQKCKYLNFSPHFSRFYCVDLTTQLDCGKALYFNVSSVRITTNRGPTKLVHDTVTC